MTGRKGEKRLLQELAESGEPEFIVVYGRRRVGKTYLVRETFGDGFFFSYTGIANINAKQQLREFAKALRELGRIVASESVEDPVGIADPKIGLTLLIFYVR